MRVYTLDIDGTLADVRHRQEFLEHVCPNCDLKPVKIANGRFKELKSKDDTYCTTCGNTGIRRPQSKDWAEFWNPDLMIKDPLYPEAKEALIRIAKRIEERGVKRVYFLTARSPEEEGPTLMWLQKKVFPIIPKSMTRLYLRKSGHAVDYKRRKLEHIYRKHDGCHFVHVDDDPTLYPMYEEFTGTLIAAPHEWHKVS